MQDNYLSSFTPSLMSPKILEAIFVQREKLVKDLIAGVRESATTQNKHYRLLVGMRGIGKTHTIALLYHRLKNEADLQDKLLIAWLKEEEWGVSTWLDLQIRIFQALADSYPEAYQDQLATNVEALYQLSPQEATARGEIILKEFILNLKNTPSDKDTASRRAASPLGHINQRTLLILTENLDQIFKGLGGIGQKKFRAYLQNNSLITIVATCQNLSRDLTSKKRAFYGFFNSNNLDKLSLEEATQLLTKIAQLQADQELDKYIQSSTGKDRIKAIHHLAGGNHRVYIIFSQFLTRDSLDDLVKPVMQTLDELTPYYQARMQWLSPQQRKIIELLCDRRHAIPVKEIAQRCFISHQTASSQLKDLLTKGYVVKETKGRESFYELQEPLMRICLEVKKQRGEPIKLFIDFLRIWYTNQELEARLQQLPDNCLEKEYILKALERQPIFTDSINFNKSEELYDLLKEILASYEQNDYQTALILCKKAIKIDDESNSVWNVHGYILYTLDRYQEAIQSYEQAIKIDSKDNRAWFNRGNAFIGLGKYQEAIQSYDKAIEIDSKDYRARNSRSNLLIELDRYEEALKSYNKTIEINSEDDQALNNRGNVLVELGRYEEALKSYEQAIEINSKDNQALNNCGNVLVELGRYQEALKSYEQSRKINSEEYKTCFSYGYVLSKLGRYKEAIKSYEQAIKINHKNDTVWNAHGYAFSKLGRHEEAIKSYKQAIEINNQVTLPFLNLGEVLLKINRWHEGFANLEKGLDLIKDTEESYTGDTEEIIKIIFKVKDNWNSHLKNLVAIYDKHQLVSELSKGITENITDLLSEKISNKAARTWLEVWQEVAGDKPELEIALRWLKTAVEYKETKGDSKVLLQLPKEERDLFITLLEDTEK